MKISSAILFYLVFTCLIAIPPFALQQAGSGLVLPSGFWTVFGFMSGLTFIVLMIMLVVSVRNHDYFTQAFLGGTTLKIVACLIFMLIFLRKNAENKGVFLVDFIYIYLLNTVFEVYILLRTLRLKNLR